MNYPIFTGNVKNGKLFFEDRETFDRYLTSLIGQVQIIVKKKRKQRSVEQNNYYWGVVIPILMDYCGYTKEQMHNALIMMFLKVEGKIPTFRGSSELNTLEFCEFVDRVVIWAAMELNVVIPPPEKIG